MTYKREGPLDPHPYDPFLPRLALTIIGVWAGIAMASYDRWIAAAFCLVVFGMLYWIAGQL
jgi:hypothetical protein